LLGTIDFENASRLDLMAKAQVITHNSDEDRPCF
jgi:hypothetical protein